MHLTYGNGPPASERSGVTASGRHDLGRGGLRSRLLFEVTSELLRTSLVTPPRTLHVLVASEG